MQIGIGITTTSNRTEHLDLCLRQIEKHSPETCKIHIAKDFDTIAKAKNDCLFNLKECEEIFLFDDDCFPINDYWINLFTRYHGHSHFLYLTLRHVVTGYSCGSDIIKYNNSGGCFMYIGKDAFNRAGYFNTKYKAYGFEHAGYTARIGEGNLSLRNVNKYLYSFDYQGEGNWGVKHKPSITDYKLINESLEYNRKIYEEEINSKQIYYPYENFI